MMCIRDECLDGTWMLFSNLTASALAKIVQTLNEVKISRFGNQREIDVIRLRWENNQMIQRQMIISIEWSHLKILFSTGIQRIIWISIQVSKDIDELCQGAIYIYRRLKSI